MIRDCSKELRRLPARELLPGHGLGPEVRNGASQALSPLIGLVVALLIVVVGATERLQAARPLPAPADVRLGGCAGSPGPRPEPGPASAQAGPGGGRLRRPWVGAGWVGAHYATPACQLMRPRSKRIGKQKCFPRPPSARTMHGRGRRPGLGARVPPCVLFASCGAPLCVLFASYRLGNSARVLFAKRTLTGRKQGAHTSDGALGASSLRPVCALTESCPPAHPTSD